MENFRFYMPTEIVYGQDIIKEAGANFALGKKAMVVTGRSSAKRSGALDDVLEVLQGDYVVFSEVENNPSLDTVARGGKLASEAGCDYIVAIGGGSPLDAAKAIAVLAVNSLHPLELYKTRWATPALPLIAIPTTAGTGSEVTPYAVLTVEQEETKKSVAGPDLFPKVAYLDPKYTASLPLAVTVDTAVDALSHLLESYLSTRATAASDLTVLQGLALWGTAIPALRSSEFDLEVRSSLLLASALGGIAIAQTGTALVHALGYPLTYYHGYPHGRANGILLGEYLKFTEKMAPQRLTSILELLELESVGDFVELMDELFVECAGKLKLNSRQIDDYVGKAALTKNVLNSLGQPSVEQLTKILQDSILR